MTRGPRARARRRCSLLAWALIAIAGCEAPPTTAPRLASQARMKEALFGDPGLVPTREGERARRELALAGSIEEHLAGDPDVDAVRADVTVAPERTPQAIISVHSRGPAEALRQRSERVARAIVGDPATSVTVDIVSTTAPAQGYDAQPRTLLTLVLALALLALGASAGITLDRMRQRPGRRSPS